MDFRTEWSSWVMLVVMMIIAYVVSPWDPTGSLWMFLAQVIAYPLLIVALACIPVLIVCYIIKVIPDIDYSIRLGFAYMLILLIMHFVN